MAENREISIDQSTNEGPFLPACRSAPFQARNRAMGGHVALSSSRKVGILTVEV